MRLLGWIEQMLERIAPTVTYLAGEIANIASVLASVSWLLTQALNYVSQNYA